MLAFFACFFVGSVALGLLYAVRRFQGCPSCFFTSTKFWCPAKRPSDNDSVGIKRLRRAAGVRDAADVQRRQVYTAHSQHSGTYFHYELPALRGRSIFSPISIMGRHTTVPKPLIMSSMIGFL